MSIASIVTFGFGSYSTVNLAVVLGYGANSTPPEPVATPATGGAADKRRSKDEYYKKKFLKKQARVAKVKPRLREQPIKVIEHVVPAPLAPVELNLDKLAAGKNLFAAAALLQPIILTPEPFESDTDDDDLYILME